MRIRLFLVLVCVLAITPLAHAETAGRGLFIWGLEDKPVLSSKAQVEEAIDFAKKYGIRTLFVQVYRANQAWFPSKVADAGPYTAAYRRNREDTLAYMIKLAHQEGIEVHAWMNLLSLSANKHALLLKKYGPSILTRNKDPKTSLEDYKIDNQYFLEPSDARVHQELLTVVGELLKAYPALDGIQFDYIRYPDVHPFYGYSQGNMERFKKASGVAEIIEEDPRWKQWKRDQVSEFVEMLVKKVRSINPKIHISATGCLSYSRAYHEALQDWPSWLNRNLVEFVTLMNYPPDFPEYEKNIVEIKKRVKDYSKINMAVGSYKFVRTPELFKKQFDYCEASGARSCVIFHYNNFLESPALAEVLGTKGSPSTL